MGGQIAHVGFRLIALTDQFLHRNLMVGPFSHQREAANTSQGAPPMPRFSTSIMRS
jgi:hypothetical protein